MIYVKRSNVRVPALFDHNGKNTAETTRAIEHYRKKGKKGFSGYKTYRNELVKEAIILLFKEKCAYCESKMLATQPGDIEHFRPKNEVLRSSGGRLRPGYFWLAAEWDNLLLSCIGCNRQQKHAIPGEAKKLTLGKLNQFPLSDEKARWTNYRATKGFIKEERVRLLIHPCKDKPEKFFEYDEFGLIRPQKGLSAFNRQKAEKSITTYALQRMSLVNARKEFYINFIKQVYLEIEQLKKDNRGKAKRKNLRRKINEKISRLLALADSNKEYSGMVKFFLNKDFANYQKKR